MSKDLRIWEKQYLRVGCYDGPTLPGFPYKLGQHVPVAKRSEAMRLHREALARASVWNPRKGWVLPSWRKPPPP